MSEVRSEVSDEAPIEGATETQSKETDRGASVDVPERVWRATSAGEGTRVGVVGDSGSGKTFAMVRLAEAYLKASPGCALIVDDKEPRPRFAGQQRKDVAELERSPAAPDPRSIVFRGDLFAGYKVQPEQVAALAWKISHRRVPVLMVCDEIERAATNGQWRKDSRWVKQTFTEGRAVGISCLWGAQMPQQVPQEAFDQSGFMLIFKLDGMGADLLVRRRVLTPEQARQVAQLPGQEVPKEQRGYFFLFTRGGELSGPHRLAR